MFAMMSVQARPRLIHQPPQHQRKRRAHRCDWLPASPVPMNLPWRRAPSFSSAPCRVASSRRPPLRRLRNAAALPLPTSLRLPTSRPVTHHFFHPNPHRSNPLSPPLFPLSSHLLGPPAPRSCCTDTTQLVPLKPNPRRWWGSEWWSSLSRNVKAVVVVLALGTAAIFYANLETVPYTNRKHLLLLPSGLECRMGDCMFKQIKVEESGEIMRSKHRESIRVRTIFNKIIDSVNWELQHGSKLPPRHLEDLKWEVVVVRDPTLNAMCGIGGKIIVHTGMLVHLRTDDELATVIAHEIGHAVARHPMEQLTMFLCLVVWRVLVHFCIPNVPLLVKCVDLLVLLLLSHEMEKEADYIGLLLMSSAGYDPRVAPGVHRKLEDVDGWEFMYNLAGCPSGEVRAQLLSRDHIMEEAMDIYSRNKSRPVEGIPLKFFCVLAGVLQFLVLHTL